VEEHEPVTDEDTEPAGADERSRLADLLRRLGATEAEIADAFSGAAKGPSDVALELALRKGRAPLRLDEAAAQSGLTTEEFGQVWQALGFQLPRDADFRIPAAIAETLPIVATATREWLGDATARGLARLVGATTAQLAEAVVDAFRVGFELPQLASGTAYSDVIEQYIELTRASLPAFEALICAALEAHLVRVAAGAWAPDDDQVAARRDLLVGFADLVGYTALSRTMTPGELATLLVRFEEAVGDALSRHRGRPVKLIGDGVMFVADSAADGCAAALAICEAVDAAELPPVRIGLDHGPVLSRSGDYFGEVVNRAARLVALARPATVVVTDGVVAALGESWPVEQLPPQALKGFQAPAVTYRLVAR
jgi:adenylate cyclase